MPIATVYKIKKMGYLVFGLVKTVSGFSVGIDPYIRISENNTDDNIIADAIKAAMNTDDNRRISDPKNWSELNKVFLEKTGLKSSKELSRSTTTCCNLRRENSTIIFTPTKHAEKPDEGFVNKSKGEPKIIVPLTASSREIVDALGLAFSRCE